MTLTIDKQRERHIRSGLDYLIPLYEVRQMLGLSWLKMMEIVKSGDLPVISRSGERLTLADIDEDTRGLAVLPSDLQTYIEAMRVK
jgi:hypothetical protein